jgi:hypothetical protein
VAKIPIYAGVGAQNEGSYRLVGWRKEVEKKQQRSTDQKPRSQRKAGESAFVEKLGNVFKRACKVPYFALLKHGRAPWMLVGHLVVDPRHKGVEQQEEGADNEETD